MRPAPLPVLLLALLGLGGCFETSDAAFTVTAASATVTRTTADTGDVSFTVRNTHAEAISGIALAIRFERLEGNGSVALTSLELAERPASVVGSAGAYTITTMAAGSAITITPKRIYEPGRYRWTVSVNDDRAHREFAYDDDVATTTVVVSAVTPPPGLDIAVSAPTSVTPGDDGITLSVPITVAGPTSASAYAVRFDVLAQGNPTFGYHIYDRIAVGSRVLTLTAPIPAGGAGTIEIIADPFDAIDEADEANNTVSFAFPATGGG